MAFESYPLEVLALEPWAEIKFHIALEESKRFIQFCYEIYGSEKFVELLGKLKTMPFDRAIKETLVLSMEKLEDEFDRWLKDKGYREII